MVAEGKQYAERMLRFVDRVDIYPVSCERLCSRGSDKQWLDAVLAGGAAVVQLRDKDSEDRELLAKARYFREQTRRAGALFIVNDRLDIAMLADADGLHVGQKDLPAEELRRLVPDMIIGVSCNTEEQAYDLGLQEKRGELAASYYNIGPIYRTGTKEGLSTFIGPEAIARFSRHCSLPFTVMGGIKSVHIPELVTAGACRIAVVTAINQQEDMAAATRDLRGEIRTALGVGDG
jgi:thiamine-phosphate pyrophosphorylase